MELIAMDDFLFYSILASLLVGILLAALRTVPGCAGDCELDDTSCTCRD